MRACVQRVTSARVTVGDEETGRINGRGFVVLLGVEQGDTEKDLAYMVDKVVGLRVFEDDDGKMNRSIIDARGEMLVVSQFTLLGDCRRGKRPSFVQAAPPDIAEAMYEQFVQAVRAKDIVVACGRFQAQMRVQLVNDGPVTILLDSKKKF